MEDVRKLLEDQGRGILLLLPSGRSTPSSTETPWETEFLKLAEKTVYSMAQRGELPMFKVRGQWRIHRADFNEWMDQKRRRGGGNGGPAQENEGGAKDG